MIKADYSSDAVQGLLAADTLWPTCSRSPTTWCLRRAEPQPVRQTDLARRALSLPVRDAVPPERADGVPDALDDFDERYPGTYAGRIEYVEVRSTASFRRAGLGDPHQRRHLALPHAGALRGNRSSSTACRTGRRRCCPTSTSRRTRFMSTTTAGGVESSKVPASRRRGRSRCRRGQRPRLRRDHRRAPHLHATRPIRPRPPRHGAPRARDPAAG